MADAGNQPGLCPTCGHRNPEGAGFCGRCGARIERQDRETGFEQPERPVSRALPVTLGVVLALGAVAVIALSGPGSEGDDGEMPQIGPTGRAAPTLVAASPTTAGCWNGELALDCPVLSALTAVAASGSAGTGVLTAPTSDGELFVATGTGRDGAVYRLAVDNGELSVVWSRFLPQAVQVAPTAVPGMVFAAGVGGSGSGSTLYALDADTGETLWDWSLDILVRLPVIAVEEDAIAVAGGAPDSENDELLIVDVGTGNVRERSTVRGRVLSLTADPGRGVAYYTDAAGLHAFDPGVGELWQAPGDHIAPLGPGMTTLYVSQLDGTLTARAADSNTVPWRVSDLSGVHYPPVADDDTVVVIDDEGTLRAFDTRTGGATGTVRTQDMGAVRGPAVLFGDTIAIPTTSGLLFAHLPTGRTAQFRPRGRTSEHNQISGARLVGDGVLLITGPAGAFVVDSPAFH